MSFTKEVKNKAGVTKVVVADNEAELNEAVKAVEAERAPVSVDINQPVAKGHDLLHVEEDGITQGLVDGRGVHNSPLNAIDGDGTENGNPDDKDGDVQDVPSPEDVVPAPAKKNSKK